MTEKDKIVRMDKAMMTTKERRPAVFMRKTVLITDAIIAFVSVSVLIAKGNGSSALTLLFTTSLFFALAFFAFMKNARISSSGSWLLIGSYRLYQYVAAAVSGFLFCFIPGYMIGGSQRVFAAAGIAWAAVNVISVRRAMRA